MKKVLTGGYIMKVGRASTQRLSKYVKLALLIGINLSVSAQGDQILLSFDSIFPATPYKEALGSCMQALSYLDQLCHEHERGEEMTITLVHDAFLGKVTLAQHKLAHLIIDIQAGSIVADDNVHYLSAILGHIKQVYQERLDSNQRNTLAVGMIDDMVLQVSRIIE